MDATDKGRRVGTEAFAGFSRGRKRRNFNFSNRWNETNVVVVIVVVASVKEQLMLCGLDVNTKTLRLGWYNEKV